MDSLKNPTTWIALLVLAACLFFALRHILRQKRRGAKCIGCPYACGCEKKRDRSCCS